MLKAVCLDLDGTLLDDDKKVSKESLEVLSNLAKNNFNHEHIGLYQHCPRYCFQNSFY